MKKLNIAIIGQGRSGRDIHGRFYKSQDNQWFNVRYVVELDWIRRGNAADRYPGCEVLSDYRELFGKTDIDLVVNCTYSDMHYPITKDLLEHGFNVLVEKPFARNVYECETLIKTARDRGLVLAVFQQTFFAPFYQHILKTIDSGLLGEILGVSIRYSGFSRRWDWQTLQKKMGGSAYNTGPHPFGIALGILGFDPHTRVAYSRLESTPLTSGDADDFVKVILDAPGKPFVDVEITSTDAYPGCTVKLQGTKGTYQCTPARYECRYIVDGENPDRPVIEASLRDREENPVYCSEKLNVHEESGEFDGSAFDVGPRDLYRNLYGAITTGEPLYVTPEKAEAIISVIETIHAENPLPVRL